MILLGIGCQIIALVIFQRLVLNNQFLNFHFIICQVKLENLLPNTFSKNTSNGV